MVRTSRGASATPCRSPVAKNGGMTIQPDFDAADARLTLACAQTSVMVAISADELLTLESVGDALWTGRRSIAAGTVLGHQAFWCVADEADEVQLLVGHDDETWELALSVPRSVVDCAVLMARDALAARSPRDLSGP